MIEKTASITQGRRKTRGKVKWLSKASIQGLKIAATEQRGCGIYKSEERQNNKRKFIKF